MKKKKKYETTLEAWRAKMLNQNTELMLSQEALMSPLAS